MDEVQITFISNCDCPECQQMRQQVAILEARHILAFNEGLVIEALKEQYLGTIRAYQQSQYRPKASIAPVRATR